MVLTPETSEMLQENAFPETLAVAPLQVTPARPDRLSEAVPVTCSWGALTVAPVSGELMLITGGVKSMLSVALAEAEFPA
jgi:hypothetical protein